MALYFTMAASGHGRNSREYRSAVNWNKASTLVGVFLVIFLIIYYTVIVGSITSSAGNWPSSNWPSHSFDDDFFNNN